LSLRGLKDAGAKVFLPWIAAFAIICRFRSEVFGKRSGEQKKLGAVRINYLTSLNKKVADELINEGRIFGVCNNQVRYLADLPSNVLSPRTYKEEVQALARSLKVEFEFIDKKALVKKGAGAFLAVIKGDLNDVGGICHLRYKGKK